MSARVLDGKWVRDQILAELRPRIERITRDHRPPGLAVVFSIRGGIAPTSTVFATRLVPCRTTRRGADGDPIMRPIATGVSISPDFSGL